MAQAEVKKYLVTGCKEYETGGNWYIKTTSLIYEAENKTAAEWQARNQGYTPLSVVRFKPKEGETE